MGILQALSSTGQVTFGTAIPIIMGQNIGTCVTALLSSVGTNKNARRAAIVHLCFNVIGTTVWLSVFCILNGIFHFGFVSQPTDQLGIAVVHTIFNVLCTCLMLPASGLLEKLACKIIPDTKTEESKTELDERLMATPSIALERCRVVTGEMAADAANALKTSLRMVSSYDPEQAVRVREQEEETDHYEDSLGTYLVKLSTCSLSDEDSNEAAKLLHVIGDFERISDHAVNILESAEEIQEKHIQFSPEAEQELQVISSAVEECLELALKSFMENDLQTASKVEPLEEVIDTLRGQLRSRHVLRLQKGECTIEDGFVWSDLLTSLERVSDHCSNIAGCVIEMAHSSLDLHEYLGEIRTEDPQYIEDYNGYAKKYALVK